ncbi:ATPase PAAT isoform X2 [Myripristis murdjan]|uniref:ATPase PAAT isoform X2 n=1 Tax=Myripristis murdjan TaxID=586833 RepID=UPI0011763CA9|nr:uncharacterized protein C10orf88 homolog isoform X2 [Myripristis murdjan]
MADIAVGGGSAWVCRGQLADILLPVYITDDKQEVVETGRDEPDSSALLEQLEAGAPCVLTLRCGSAPSAPPAAIRSVLVVSEARTMEVYGPTGDYCGTGRGERDGGLEPDSSDRGPFYRKQLILEQPSTSCEVKLLSLGGRNSVLVLRVVLGLQPARPGPARGPGIDLQRVQSLVEEMGTGLSPGARSLMDMVQLQQQNQAGSLAGFLPLLMGGGVLPARSRGAEPAGLGLQISRQHAAAGPADGAQNGAPRSDESDPASPPPRPNPLRFDTNSASEGPESSAQLVQMMSHFLNGHGRGQALSSAPELLPMLQRVCGQVTQLRLDDAAEKGNVNGGWALDPAMERRLEQMERSLKEHIDRRLDALERRLEAALLLLPGGAAPAGAAEKILSDQTPACTESTKPDA